MYENHQNHADLLDHTVTVTEALCAVLTGNCGDVVRQKTDAVRQEWDALFAKIAASQRQLEIRLVEWMSYNDSISQIEMWLVKMRTLVVDELPLLAILDEKKTQLHTCKVW